MLNFTLCESIWNGSIENTRKNVQVWTDTLDLKGNLNIGTFKCFCWSISDILRTVHHSWVVGSSTSRDQKNECWKALSHILSPGSFKIGSWCYKAQRDVHRPVQLLEMKTGNQQQCSCHQVEDACNPATKQGIAELPARDNLRHCLVEESHKRQVGNVRDRDKAQDPCYQAQCPAYCLQRPLTAKVIQVVVAAINQADTGDGQQHTQQSHPQHQGHENPGQYNVWRQFKHAVIGPALQLICRFLAHTGHPEAHVSFLSGKQVCRQCDPWRHQDSGQGTDPGHYCQTNPQQL